MTVKNLITNGFGPYYYIKSACTSTTSEGRDAEKNIYINSPLIRKKKIQISPSIDM